MRINVKVKTGKNKSQVIKNGFADYEVWVKAQPVRGAANKEVIDVLAKYFNVKKFELRIITGLMVSKKIIEIIE